MILLGYTLFSAGYRLQDLFRCPQSHLSRGQCSTTQGAHTKYLHQQRNNRLTRRPIFKGSPQNPTLPLVCAKTPTLRLLLPAAEKFWISPALACMFKYKLLIMKCELLFCSFTIQPQPHFRWPASFRPYQVSDRWRIGAQP